jgi:hypothetical protein
MPKEKIESPEGKPKRIRIIATPSTNGPIPLDVRRHWVGLELEAYSTDTVMKTVAKRFPQLKSFYESRKDYYHVSVDDAIEALRRAKRPKEVIKFWEDMKQALSGLELLSFEPNVCVEL